MSCQLFVFLDTVIEDDDELFFIRKLPISAKKGHIPGPVPGKIGICSDILVTRRVKES